MLTDPKHLLPVLLFIFVWKVVSTILLAYRVWLLYLGLQEQKRLTLIVIQILLGVRMCSILIEK